MCIACVGDQQAREGIFFYVRVSHSPLPERAVPSYREVRVDEVR